MHISPIETFFFAIAGGLFPAVVWLWFWLQEDAKNPEPKSLVVTTFIAGMLTVPFVLYLEIKVDTHLESFLRLIGIYNTLPLSVIGRYGLLSIIILALIEEVGKYVGANAIALHNRNYDEPVDLMIYLISAALGFAALENGLFLVRLIEDDFSIQFIALSNDLRFIGATLVHVLASGVMGGIGALAFYKSRFKKFIYLGVGLTTAVILHAIFNFLIIRSSEHTLSMSSILSVFAWFWGATIILIILFERVKLIRKQPYAKKTIIS